MNINSSHGLSFVLYINMHDTITFDSYHMSALKHQGNPRQFRVLIKYFGAFPEYAWQSEERSQTYKGWIYCRAFRYFWLVCFSIVFHHLIERCIHASYGKFEFSVFNQRSLLHICFLFQMEFENLDIFSYSMTTSFAQKER